MGSPESVGVQSPGCSALVHLLHSGALALASTPGSDALAFLDRDTCRSRTASSVWHLAAVGGAAAGSALYTLRETAAPARFLTAVDGRLALVEQPPEEPLQLFRDLDRRVVLRLPGKACLQAGAGGAALVGRLPLGRHRSAKLFTLEEAAVPSHSLQAWPLCCTLRPGDQPCGGGYLSASGLALAAAAPVACCSERFVLALGEAAPLGETPAAGGAALVARGSGVWTADGTRLLSHEAGTGQARLLQQHGCSGGERFTLLLSRKGELSLLAEAPPQQQRGAAQPSAAAATSGDEPACDSGSGSAGGSAAAPAPLVLGQHGMLSSRTGAKPTPFALELASGRPTLLLTAHGQLLSCASRLSSSRPCGLLPRAAAGDGAAPGSAAGTSAAAAAASAWLLQHHGEGVYSLRHATSGCSLHLDEHGSPCMDAPGSAATLTYPDERLLFWIEPAWVTLPALPAGGSRASIDSSSSSSSDDASPAAAPAVPGFVQPAACGGGLTAAGFAIRSLHLVGGRHLYLSVLPDGLVTTVYANRPPSRFELFCPIDHATLATSPLLAALPCAAPAPPLPLQLRRTASEQVLGGSSGWCGSPLAAAPRSPFPRAPSLPSVQEHGPLSGGSGQPGTAAALQADLVLLQQSATDGPRPPRRSQSDTALAALQHASAASRPRRPLWLAELLQPEREPQGWGITSAARLQELACRQLCTALVQRYQEQDGHRGRRLSAGLVAAVEEELSAHLPENVASLIGQELRVLVGPPPPTKLPLQQLCKALAAAAGVASGSSGSGVPPWAVPFLQPSEPGVAEWQAAESGYLCACCKGESGRLLPLDPWVNPSHYLFLAAMERRARGGGRTRLRARRRLDREDPLVATLKAGKVVLFAWALGRTLSALFCSPS